PTFRTIQKPSAHSKDFECRVGRLWATPGETRRYSTSKEERNMKRSIISSVAAGVLLSLAALAGSVLLTSADGATAGKASKRPEGTWAVQVTIHDCQTGQDVRTFPALLTFAQGGTLTETTAGFPPAARTPGHGFWRFAGGDAYEATSMA